MAPQAFGCRHVFKSGSRLTMRCGMRLRQAQPAEIRQAQRAARRAGTAGSDVAEGVGAGVTVVGGVGRSPQRSEEHTSELQSLMRISYAVFCLKKKKKKRIQSRNIISYLF